jgi:hypothetical protein
MRLLIEMQTPTANLLIVNGLSDMSPLFLPPLLPSVRPTTGTRTAGLIWNDLPLVFAGIEVVSGNALTARTVGQAYEFNSTMT